MAARKQRQSHDQKMFDLSCIGLPPNFCRMDFQNHPHHLTRLWPVQLLQNRCLCHSVHSCNPLVVPEKHKSIPIRNSNSVLFRKVANN